MSRRRQECELARHAQGELRAELQIQERIHREARLHASQVWCMPAPSLTNPENREFVVDSGASMHVLSKKDSNSAEMMNSASFQHSCDGFYSQSRGANKRGSDSVCHGTGVVRDIDAPRRYTSSALA